MESNSTGQGTRVDPGKRTGAWISIGIAIGVGLGVALEKIALGMAIGLALGAAIGTLQSRKNRQTGFMLWFVMDAGQGRYYSSTWNVPYLKNVSMRRREGNRDETTDRIRKKMKIENQMEEMQWQPT
jgi:hypothetical protein